MASSATHNLRCSGYRLHHSAPCRRNLRSRGLDDDRRAGSVSGSRSYGAALDVELGSYRSRRLLDANPPSGMRKGREPNPRRPIATWDRFIATRQAIRDLLQDAATESERRRWARVDLAVVLAEGTGRRLGAIRQLQWNDIDWDHKTIRWRAESDKKRREWVVPAPDGLVAELRQFQRQVGAVGGLVFPSERNPQTPMSRHEFRLWLEAAEARARLPKLEGGLWHPYRRKWATERKQLPITDVAAAGGWHDTATLIACYQQPTNDALLAVMSEERKVRDVAVLGGDLRRNG